MLYPEPDPIEWSLIRRGLAVFGITVLLALVISAFAGCDGAPLFTDAAPGVAADAPKSDDQGSGGAGGGGVSTRGRSGDAAGGVAGGEAPDCTWPEPAPGAITIEPCADRAHAVCTVKADGGPVVGRTACVAFGYLCVEVCP